MKTICPGLDNAPYLTPEIPGIPGSLKSSPEDFFVEETPLYPPSGSGEHLLFKIEKKGISTFEALRRISGALGLPPSAFGHAGLKDSRAVARQYLSVSGVDRDDLLRLELKGLRILEVSRHANKLRVGHLKGNRFRIRYAGAGAENAERARELLLLLKEKGVPNPYMSQRFGRRGTTHLLGKALLLGNIPQFIEMLLEFDEGDGAWGVEASRATAQGDFRAALALVPATRTPQRNALLALARGEGFSRAARAVPGRNKQLYLSAYQAFLFNLVLSRRLPFVDSLEAGDLAYLHRNGAVFEVHDPEVERHRAREKEISPSGPIFGYKMPFAGGRWGEVERSLASSEAFNLETWRIGAGLSQKGARRPLRFPLAGESIEVEGDDLIFSFFLPKGCYATAVFREIGKDRME